MRQGVLLHGGGGQVDAVGAQRFRLAGQAGLEQFGGLRHVDVHHRSEVGRPSGEVTHRLRHVTAGPGDGGRERREAHSQRVELGAGQAQARRRRLPELLDSGGCGTEGDVDGVDRFAELGRLAGGRLDSGDRSRRGDPAERCGGDPRRLADPGERRLRTLPGVVGVTTQLAEPVTHRTERLTSLVLADQAEDEVCASRHRSRLSSSDSRSGSRGARPTGRIPTSR